MRLKIKPVQPPTSPELQCQENRQALDVIDPDEVPKMAEVKEEEDHQWLVPVDNTEENPIVPPELPPPTPVVDQYLGKRKRKPKELIDEVSPILFRRKKKPAPVPKSEHQGIPDGGKRNTSKREDGSSNIVVKSPTLIRAEEVMASLGNEYPCFMKLLVRSHVASCFWMGLPVPFCKAHLPKKDCAVALESENGERFEIKYIAEKTGLSAGWRKFVAAHKLVEGDVLVFQLVGPTKFKMMVIRSHDLSEVDGALSLLNLDAFTKQSDANAMEGSSDSKLKRKRRPKSLPLTVVQKKKQKSHLDAVEEHSGNDSDEVASEVLDASKLSMIGALRFRDIKSFEDFHITVNGVCIDSDLPDMVRRKYYDLCCSKNVFIHERFLPGLHSKLAAGMIYEAVSTADAIKACQVTTSIDEFEKWEKSLRSFELLGMNVGFLRARLSRLRSLAFDFEGALETKKYWEVVNDRSTTEDEINKLEIKLVELRELAVKQDSEIEGLKSMAENYELMFQEEVNAPW